MIGRHPIHARARQTCAAKNIPASQYDRDLNPHLGQVANFSGDSLKDDRIDAVVLVSQQRFAG
jgi:hypothetical protein